MKREAIMDYFIPKSIQAASVSENFRARILVVSTLAAAAAVVPFVFIRLHWNGAASPFFLVLVLSVGILVSTPFLLRWTRAITAAGLYVTLGSALILGVFSFIDGGYRSSALLWFPTIPLFTVFFAGRSFGILSALIMVAELAFLAWAHAYGIVPAVQVSEEQLSWLYFLSTGAVLMVLLVLAFLYLSWQRAVQFELQQANRAKSEFLSTMSHELRTPLNAIIGFAQALARGYPGVLNDKQSEYVSYIRSSGDQLLELVDDVLDLAKIDAGKMAFAPALVNIEAVVSESLRAFQAKAQEKGIQLTCVLGDRIAGASAYLDERKFRQVIYNLLSNAVKFTPSGGRVVLGGNIENGNLVIDVRDTGPGIAPEYRERVFEKFFRLEPEAALKVAGTGLGLALCRQFVSMHGGKIWVESAGGSGGARLVVQLPLRAAPASPESGAAGQRETVSSGVA